MLPNIQRFSQITTTGKKIADVTKCLCRQGEIESFVEYDVLRNRTRILPFQTLAVPSFSNWICLRKFKWNAMRDEDDNVLIGSVADLEARIDDGGWIETIEGARFPREVENNAIDSARSGGIRGDHQRRRYDQRTRP